MTKEESLIHLDHKAISNLKHLVFSALLHDNNDKLKQNKQN